MKNDNEFNELRLKINNLIVNKLINDKVILMDKEDNSIINIEDDVKEILINIYKVKASK